jgi:hypothetical protein
MRDVFNLVYKRRKLSRAELSEPRNQCQDKSDVKKEVHLIKNGSRRGAFVKSQFPIHPFKEPVRGHDEQLVPSFGDLFVRVVCHNIKG